ncbi:MAG: prolipoprotein diacylglyceryl transferase [Clostridia bacterium]|nr:prolipoprotein diacylglyceryl transferase [Clostridia bacterium]
MLPEPIINLFGRGVYMYGVCIAIGLIACIAVFYIYTGKRGMHTKLQDFVLFLAIGAIALGFLCGKLYQAVYDFIETGKFDFYGAGMTVMGGLIGGAAVFLLGYFLIGKFYFKGELAGIHVKQFNIVFLVAPICIVIAHAFGRIGCLMSGCCHGAYLGKEYVFGGIWMKAPDTGLVGYHVPTQLYEALFLFVLFGVLSLLYFKKCNIIMHLYLISYGFWRIFIEFFRTDARGAIILGLAPSQWQSFIFIGGGVALILFYLARKIPLWLSDNKQAKK